MKIFLLALFLFSCVTPEQKPVELAFHESPSQAFDTLFQTNGLRYFSSKSKDGTATQIYCVGVEDSALTADMLKGSQAFLGKGSSCFKSVCQNEKCQNYGDPNNRKIYFAAQQEVNRLKKSCDNGKGEYLDCLTISESSIPLDLNEVRKNLCARPDDFECKPSSGQKLKDASPFSDQKTQIIPLFEVRKVHYAGKFTEPSTYQFPASTPPEEKAYMESVFNKLEHLNTYPEWARRLQIQGSIQTKITILPSGTILDVKVVKTSKNKWFDDNFVDDVKRSAPFGPFPKSMKRKDIEFNWGVTYSLK